MRCDLVVKNGTIVTAESSYQADVGIKGESIAGIGHSLEGAAELDATGCLVIPGAIDGHVHLQYPIGSLRSADDFFSGTRAAALGGTTTVIDFVEAQGDQPLLPALAGRRAEAERRVAIDFSLHMTIKPDDIAKLDQVPGVIAAGCPSFKHYMAYAFRLRDDELLQSFRAIAQAGGLAIVHAENWDVIQLLIRQNLAAGRTEPRWHPRSRPEALEGEAAGRAIDLAAYAGVPLYIFHVSCGAVVERIAVARRRGLPVSGETCPQYLLLDQELYDRPGVAGALPVCSPPLRPKAEQERLWQALAAAELQVVSTDHCPFTCAEKGANLADFSRIPGGVPSIESRLALLYTFGVGQGHLSLQQWVACSATRPARLFGLERKGRIAPGYDADLVIFDPAASRRLSLSTLHEQVDWTPYDGLVVDGWPRHTLSRGRLVVEEGAFVGQAGQGRFVPRRFSTQEG